MNKLNIYVIVDTDNNIVKIPNRLAVYSTLQEAKKGLQWGNLTKRNCSIKRLEEVEE